MARSKPGIEYATPHFPLLALQGHQILLADKRIDIIASAWMFLKRIVDGYLGGSNRIENNEHWVGNGPTSVLQTEISGVDQNELPQVKIEYGRKVRVLLANPMGKSVWMSPWWECSRYLAHDGQISEDRIPWWFGLGIISTICSVPDNGSIYQISHPSSVDVEQDGESNDETCCQHSKSCRN